MCDFLPGYASCDAKDLSSSSGVYLRVRSASGKRVRVRGCRCRWSPASVRPQERGPPGSALAFFFVHLDPEAPSVGFHAGRVGGRAGACVPASLYFSLLLFLQKPRIPCHQQGALQIELRGLVYRRHGAGSGFLTWDREVHWVTRG